MRRILTVIQHETLHRRVLTLDEDSVFTCEGEKVEDLLLGVIAASSRSTLGPSAIATALNTLATKGLRNYRSAILPGAFEAMTVDPDFYPTGVREIIFELDRQELILEEETIALHEFLSEPIDRHNRNAEKPYDMRRGGSHIFAYRYIPGDADVHPSDLEAGSIVAGLYEALGTPTYGAFNANAAMLTGVLLGLRGDLFCADVSGTARGGASSLREMRSNFLIEGVMQSDRAWMPRRLLPGPGLARTLTAARPDLRELGAGFAPLMLGLDPVLVHKTLLRLLELIGEDPVQYSVDRWMEPASSAHERYALETFLRQMAATAGVNPDELLRGRLRAPRKRQ